ncbi:MAG: hypothetical protein ABW019_08420, partial [Chitinophagaceae bacterium]
GLPAQSSRLLTQYSLLVPGYRDTADANTQPGTDARGTVIFTYDIGRYWYRQHAPARWTRLSKTNMDDYILNQTTLQEDANWNVVSGALDSLIIRDTTDPENKFYAIKFEELEQTGEGDYSGLFISYHKNGRWDKIVQMGGENGIGAVGNYYNEIGGHPQIFAGNRNPAIRNITGLWIGGAYAHWGISRNPNNNLNTNPDDDVDLLYADTLGNVWTGITANSGVRKGKFVTYGYDEYYDARPLSGLQKVYKQHADSNYVSASSVASGSYTPTATYVANTSAGSANVSQYIKLGDRVTVTGYVDFLVTASGTASEVAISLPFASNFSASTDASGTATSSNTFAIANSGTMLSADVTNDRVRFQFTSAGSSAGNSGRISYSFIYTIL